MMKFKDFHLGVQKPVSSMAFVVIEGKIPRQPLLVHLKYCNSVTYLATNLLQIARGGAALFRSFTAVQQIVLP
jgi:hypothetical protein